MGLKRLYRGNVNIASEKCIRHEYRVGNWKRYLSSAVADKRHASQNLRPLRVI